MNKVRQAFRIIVICAILLPLATLLIPTPANLPSTIEQYRGGLIATTAMAWLHVGAAWLFLLGLGGFKDRLQKAYRLICIAYVEQGISLAIYPALTTVNFWQQPIVAQLGLLTLPPLISAMLIFCGVRSFAHALREKPLASSPGVLPLAVVVGLAASYLLGAPAKLEFTYAIATATTLAVTAGLVLRIKAITGASYTNAMAWFFTVLVVNIIGVLLPLMYNAVRRELDAFLAIPAVLGGILVVKAALAFNKIKEY